MLSRSASLLSRSVRTSSWRPAMMTGLRSYSSTWNEHRHVLEQLGLEKSGNKGVFDGEWKGNGDVVPSLNPVNNQVIAEVRQVKR